jgi:two-component system nitrogen regulation response regulator NtrX
MALDILIVDDESDIRMLIGGVLEDEGYEARAAATAEQAIAALRQRVPSLIVLDVWLEGSGMDGLELLDHVTSHHGGVPVLMISGHGTIEMAVDAIKRGAYDFIEKPFKTDRLLLMVERAIEAARLRQEIAALKQRIGEDVDLIGSSPIMSQLRQQIARVAPTGSRVMVLGPPGSGKEVVARRLHSLSKRANGPFVVLNCAALHPDRLEEELFGVEDENGNARKVGTLERAHNGTLLLDEVADMPLATQGKIVRMLQDQSFARVGGTTTITVDVRVIAATNKDIDSEMADGRFREDLFYRLNVVPIRVPPLLERREDITELSRHFVTRAAAAQGLAPRELGEDAIAAMQLYDWPGNVRQLRNVVEWLLIMASGDQSLPIGADMLPPEITANGSTPIGPDQSSAIMGLPLRDAREVFEREYLIAQLDRFGGNISRTAEFVGMERSALHRKLKSLGVGLVDRGARMASD